MGIKIDENLYLAKLTRQDVDKMTGWVGYEDKLFEDYNFPQLNEREKTIWYNIKTGPDRLCYGIHKNGKLIGYISARHIDKLFKTGELGFVIDSPHVGGGVGSKVLPVFLEMFFGLGYRHMYLRVASFNDRAKRLYEKNGFQKIHVYYDKIEVDCGILGEDRYKTYAHLFRKNGKKCECKFEKMILSTQSTGTLGIIVDKIVNFIVKFK